MSACDIYAYGMISSSTLHVLEGNFPLAEGYGEIANTYTMAGGEATNAAIVLTRLGVKVKLAGNWLGDDEAGKTTKHLLDSYGIDTSRIMLRLGYHGVQEIVFADMHTRTIFGTYCQLLADIHWDSAHEEDLARAKVACIDPFFREESVQTAALAARHHVPVVTTDCLHDHDIVPYASIIILGRPFIQEHYGTDDAQAVFSRYQERTNGLVIFTQGSEAVLYARNREPIQKWSPYRIQPIDTTGAGDSFRAGAAYGLLQSWNDAETIRFAAAVAALVCLQFPGVLKAPGREDVVQFMHHHASQ